MDVVTEWFSVPQLWLFESALQPVMFAIGLGGRLDEGYSTSGWLLVGCIQLAIMLLGTADFDQKIEATGVRDQVEQGVDYGQGFWAQQRLGLVRLFARSNP